MNTLVIFSALLAVAAAAPGLISAPLIPKVNVGAAEVNVVKQRYTVQQPEYIHREVPVPVPVTRHEIVQPVVQAAPVVATYAAAPAVATYAAAPAIATYGAHYAAAPAVSTYAAHLPAISTYGAYGVHGVHGAYGAYGAHFPLTNYAAHVGAVKVL